MTLLAMKSFCVETSQLPASVEEDERFVDINESDTDEAASSQNVAKPGGNQPSWVHLKNVKGTMFSWITNL